MDQEDDGEFTIPMNVNTRLSPFIDRYFIKHFQQDHLYVFQHSNKLLMVGVTEQHPLILNPSPIKSVLLGGQEVVQVKGKKKKGGIKVNAKLDLAIITLEDGSQYKLKSYVDGFVIEINEKFNKERPLDRGYLAIIQGRII